MEKIEKKYQRKLSELGFYYGKIDGLRGPKTNKAIIAFKKSIDYKATDYLGPLTKAALLETRVTPADTSSDPNWFRIAMSHLGLKEYRGSRHNPKILEWWKKIRAPFTDDETPWCAGYVGGCLEEVGIKSTRSAAARSYMKWGRKLDKPVRGCVVVFWRGKRNGWSGHVGFVAGKDQRGNLMVLGGNQGNKVSIAPFSNARVLGYYWPSMVEVPNKNLPIINSNGRLSTNEA